MLKIRIISPYRKQYAVEGYLFSAHISLHDADALLCEWAPDEEILTFEGPKAWYNSEAIMRGMFRESKWASIRSDPASPRFLYHSHPVPAYRVPMISFVDPLIILEADYRISKAIAVISNSGSAWSTPEIKLRNEFATHPLVDLYGIEEGWRLYMKGRSSASGAPPNYMGPIEGTWNSPIKYEIMSHYKAAVCLENADEPYYVTEKFYAAAQAGCIPIYHAHTTVAAGALRQAMWVDPVDFDLNVEATLRFALDQDRKFYAGNNFGWLESTEARTAGLQQVFSRLGAILSRNAKV
jgi:hypothetical protein